MEKRDFESFLVKITLYNTVSDKYGRFRKPLLNHGSYKVSVRDVKFTQAKKSDKVEFTVRSKFPQISGFRRRFLE